MKTQVLLCLSLFFTVALTAQNPWYVDLDNGNDDTATGSDAAPYQTIPAAVDAAYLGGGGEVWVKSGVYELTRSQKFTTPATAADSVIIRPEPGGAVTFNFAVRSAFDFQVGSSYITLQGFEINGQVGELNDFWCVVAQDLWSDFGNPQGGGLAVIADGEHINVYNNYLHDCYQKGVEIADGRYINVHGNIISNIAQYSLSGGHGIMRQQAGVLEFDDPDVTGVHRWDLYGNMIFNVEQRIYSWVPRKGFMEMVIDEGKSILIDDPRQTNGTLDVMTARIAHNVVAFGAVDHIRLKSTPGLEVSNNSIYSEAPGGDGITDKVADDNPSGPNTQFTNFTAHGNAVQTVAEVFAIEMDHATGESYGSGNDPMGNTPAGAVTDNYAAVGRFKPRNEANVGIFNAGTSQLFLAPNQGNFTINPAANLPAGVGVDPTILAALTARAGSFGISIANDGWVTDNLLLSQTILDNIPGVNDGVVGNETVFADAGTFVEHSTGGPEAHILFDVVNGTWKSTRNSPGQQQFFLNEEYLLWYETIRAAYPNAAGAEFPRICYGDSYVKQDKVFPADWLTVAEITPEGNTLTEGYDNAFTLGGDLLINFDGVVPEVGDSYDLMVAGSITGADPAQLFARVLFPAGAEPDNWELTVEDVNGRQVLRFTVLEALPVELSTFTGVARQKDNVLNWTTEREADFDRFVVERSTEDTGWVDLGEVAGAGNLNGARYRYTDAAPPTLAFYRLRMIDLDGTTALSDIVVLERSGSGKQLSAFPNPSDGTFTVRPTLEMDHGGELTVYLIDGSLVRSRVVASGTTSVRVADLPRGTYLVVISAGGGAELAWVVVEH